MGGYGGIYPALSIKPPESPLEQYGQAQQIVAGQQQQQLGALQIQQQQQNIKDSQAVTQAMLQWDGKDPNSLAMGVLRNGGSGNAVFGATKSLQAMRQTASEIAKNDAITAQNNADTQAKQDDAARGNLLSIIQNPDPVAKAQQWATEFAREQASGRKMPDGLTAQYPGDTIATVLANHLALGSKLQQEANDKQKTAQEAWKSAGGQLVNVMTHETIGGLSNIPLLNQGLQTRWQVYHPGETLPDQFKLAPNASPADFERTDKLLQASEEAARGKMSHDDAQRQLAVSNAIRQQQLEANIDREGLKPVTGTDPKTGKVVAVPYSQAVQMGIKDAAEMPGTEYAKTLSGRQWLQLALTQAPQNAPASDMGISQLLDKMDKDKKLGPLAGRWNEFMTGDWGSGDPDYAALRTKMDLSSTLLGSVHTGRLGPFLLENLQSLAQTKKMDGPTLKSAFNTEIRYVQDRAMNPNEPNYVGQGGASGAAALPKGNGQAIDKATAMQFYQAAGNDPDKARQLATQNGWKVPKAQ
jgi:hypothetical protein